MLRLTIIIISFIIANINCPSYAQTNIKLNNDSQTSFTSNWSEILDQSTSAQDLKTTSTPNTITQINSPPAPNNSEYIVPPQIAPPEKLNPQTTTIPINDVPISHLTKWQFSTWKPFADYTDNPVFFNSIFKLKAEVKESLTRQNIYTVDQKGTYLQIRNLPYRRTITTTTIEPQTMTGLELQMSLIGNCFLPNSPRTDQLCTYTPGLVIDRNSIDPKYFLPLQVFQTSQVGDLVTPASFAAMQLPGFQGGANGQEIGVDLYFPNSGSFLGNSQSQQTTIERQEEIESTIAGSFSQIRQVVKANHEKTVLGRTIRGFTAFFNSGENPPLNLAIQAGAQFLPEFIPKIEGSEQPVNTQINRILFQAANNIRLPSVSFTIYSVGQGEAKSLTDDIIDLNQVPKAKYNSLWLGLSPVIDRSISNGEIFYEPTGPQRVIASGGEGGKNQNIEFLSNVNNEIFSTQNLQDFYTQIYLKFLRQDVNFIQENIYEEKMRYYPHLSFTGNQTGPEDVLRYYSGIIFAKEIMPYLGLDYTKNTNNWNLRAGAIGYLNPDRDYYSQLWGNIAKNIFFETNTNITLAGGFNYAIDRETNIGDVVSISPASELYLRSRFNWGIFSLGTIYYFGDILPNSYDDRLAIDIAIRPINTLQLSAYIAPIDQTSNRSLWGLGLTWQLQNQYNSPTFSLTWQKKEYDYGYDNFGNSLIVKDNVFTVLFKIGSPGNPFSR